MLDWIINPFGVDLGAYIVLWIALILIVIGSLVSTVIKMVFGRKP